MGIFISLESVKGGLRATGRVDGRTAAIFEGSDGYQLVCQVLSSVACAHAIGLGRYDFTYIDMNESARIAYAGPEN